MAPLPHNNTAIFYLDYVTCGHPHTAEVRIGAAGSLIEAGSMMDAFLTALGDYIRTLTVVGARGQDAGTNVSYPVVWDGAGTYGSGPGSEDESAQFISFVGRSLGGRRYRQYVYGCAIDHSVGKYRIQAGADTTVAAALAVLEALPNTPCAIDGDPVNFKQYANLGQSGYWTRQLR